MHIHDILVPINKHHGIRHFPPASLAPACLLCAAGLVPDQEHRVQSPEPRRDPALVHVAQLGPQRVASLLVSQDPLLVSDHVSKYPELTGTITC